MDNTTKALYNSIVSEKFSEANKTLAELLEKKAVERIKNVLTTQEEA